MLNDQIKFSLFIFYSFIHYFNSFRECNTLVLDVQSPVVVLDVVAPLLEPLRLEPLPQRLLHQPRRRVTAIVVAKL